MKTVKRYTGGYRHLHIRQFKDGKFALYCVSERMSEKCDTLDEIHQGVLRRPAHGGHGVVISKIKI